MSVLNVRNLSKTFISGLWPFTKLQEFVAVCNVSFHLAPGEILGLLGPNGAGKTTTIQMLLGTLTPTGGVINYFDTNFAHHRIDALKRVGYASGYDKLSARLTVYENLDIVGRIHSMPQMQRRQRIEELLTAFALWEMRCKPTGTLSAGQATRVTLAKAFFAQPDIVLLDEPTASLDPSIAHDIRQFILAQQKDRGTAMLISSHNMAEVTELCDRVLMLKKGMIIANDTPERLAQSVNSTTSGTLEDYFLSIAHAGGK